MVKVQTTLSVKINKDLTNGDTIEIVNPCTDGASISAMLFCKIMEAMHKVEVEWNEQLKGSA